jgi:hypothetical protein
VAEIFGFADNTVMLDRLIAAADATAEGQRLDAERFIREQRMLDEQVPGIWKRLRNALKSKCKQYREHFTFDVCVEDEALIRGANQRVLEVKFLRDSKVVAFECNGAGGLCTFRLDRHNVAVISDADGIAFPSEDYVADQLLSLILQSSGCSS